MGWDSWRNPVGFWILGLCNNYAYVIMLSAAVDLLDPKFNEPSGTTDDSKNETFCNPESTGAVLLADILPALATKSLAPFFFTNTQLRVVLMTYLGIVSASVSSGLGEVTFLAYSANFDRMIIAFWSSGTGGAGVFGAFSYAAFTSFLSPRTTLKVMLIIPALMTIGFYAILKRPRPEARLSIEINASTSQTNLAPEVDSSTIVGNKHTRTYNATGGTIDGNVVENGSATLHAKMKARVRLIKPLLKFMIPLALVYYLEYFINQGLFEVLYFPSNLFGLNHKEQYRWFQVDYQIGVFISRSSLHLFQIHRLWILPVLQLMNVVFLLSQAIVPYIPSIVIAFLIILFEGLLGGSSYVNTFYQIRESVSPAAKEFSLGFASMADSFGILAAALTAIPTHNALCQASIYKLT